MTIADIPRYTPSADEVELFESAYVSRLPVMLVGPTGCGKTRFVAHMAARLGRDLRTVVGNDDTTTADLLGRFLVRGGEACIVPPLLQSGDGRGADALRDLAGAS